MKSKSTIETGAGAAGFQEIRIADQELFSKFIRQTEYPTNLWSSNFAYLWAVSQSKRKKVLWKKTDGMLATIVDSDNFFYLPCLPFGKGDPAHVTGVLNQCLGLCVGLNLGDQKKAKVKLVNRPQLEFLQKCPEFNRKYRTVLWQGIERHYSIENLVFLKGKSFENIRNRVNKFHREHPEAEIRLFEADHYDDLLTLGKTWKNTSGKKYSHVYDGVYYKQLVKHYRELNQKILTVRIDGKLVGMISGSGLPNGQAWGSVIKFVQGIPGLSETLMVEFAKLLYKPEGGPEFLNVGSDLGFEGLKMFKLKFRPVLNYRRYELFLK